jgi:hypothetical protein
MSFKFFYFYKKQNFLCRGHMGKKNGKSWKDMPRGENDWKNIPMVKMKNDAKI